MPSTRVRRSAVAPAGKWVAVVDDATGQVYYWNRATNETTALGEPRPGPAGRLPAHPQGEVVAGGLGSSIVQIFAMGFGVSIGFAIIGRIFGGLSYEEEDEEGQPPRVGPEANVRGAGRGLVWASGLDDVSEHEYD